jgi:hypothetical protein
MTVLAQHTGIRRRACFKTEVIFLQPVARDKTHWLYHWQRGHGFSVEIFQHMLAPALVLASAKLVAVGLGAPPIQQHVRLLF